MTRANFGRLFTTRQEWEDYLRRANFERQDEEPDLWIGETLDGDLVQIRFVKPT